MTKKINLATVTDGKMMGTITISACRWDTRHSWGHSAEISDGLYTLAQCKCRYYNRTWEAYPFKTVIHGALRSYVESVTGINPYKEISKRDSMPMKDQKAEARRLSRIKAIKYAHDLLIMLEAVVDGSITENDAGKFFKEVSAA